MEIKVLRIKKFENSGNFKAFADVLFAGHIIVTGCKVFDGAKGLFAALPSQKKPNTEEYFPIVRIKDEGIRNAFNDAVLKAYNNGVVQDTSAPATTDEVPF